MYDPFRHLSYQYQHQPHTRGHQFWIVVALVLIPLLFISACTEQGSTAGGGGGGAGTAATVTQSSDSTSAAPQSQTPADAALAVSGSPTNPPTTPAASGSSPVAASDAPTTPVASPAAGDEEIDAPSGVELTSADAAPADEEGVSYEEAGGGGGGTNQVRVRNRKDGELRFKANVQLNRIPGPRVEPTNIAFAYASCTDCQTFAIALQINLISRTAEYVAPENAAVAVNVGCSRCVTVARAVQYTISVDDPTQVPDDVRNLIKELDRQLNDIRKTDGITAAEADERVNAVIAQFRSLAEGLRDSRDAATEETSPDATPEPGDEPDATATPDGATATPSADSTVASPTAPPTTGTPTPEPATTETPAATATVTETETVVP